MSARLATSRSDYECTVFSLARSVESGGQVEQIARTFGVDWPHLIAQIISFCIVCFLLYRFAYKPILTMLEERRQTDRRGPGQCGEDQSRTGPDRGASARKSWPKANAQATKLIEEARAAAARVQEQETQKAIAAAEQIIAKAREAAAQDHARMLAELKREVGRLVVQTTATVTGKILTPEDQRRLAEETSRQLAA